MNASVAALWNRIRPLGAWDALRPETRLDVEIVAAAVGTVKWHGAAIFPVPRSRMPTIFYAVAEDGKAWRRVQPWLIAFAGPTFSDFHGQPHVLDDQDSIESIIAYANFEYVARLEPAADTELLLCRGLRRLCEMVGRIPVEAQAFAESRERLLTRFFDAVAAGNLAAASQAIGRLRAGLHLDAPNLRFLEVHAYASVGDWSAISDHPDFQSLLEAPKPPDAGRALLEALYRREVAHEVDADNIEAAVSRWQNARRSHLRNGLPPFSGGSPQVARLYALDALANGTSPPWRTALAKSELGPLAARFAESFPESSTQLSEGPKSDPVLIAFGALVVGHKGSLADKRSALAAVEELGPSDRQRLSSAPGFAALLEDLRREVTARPPANWLEWTIQLDEPLFVARAPDIARQAADEWAHVGALANPEALSQALKIHATKPSSRNQIRRSLPHMVRWLRADPEGPRITWRTVYLAIVEIYALADADWIDGEARGAAMTMIDCSLETGPTAAEYRNLLDCTREFTPDSAGPGGAPWLLELVELLLWHNAPDAPSRDIFCRYVLDVLRPTLARVSPGLRLSAKAHADAVGWPWPVASAPPVTVTATLAEQLSGKTIAIYTLVERAAEQARILLGTLAPATRVETLADHGNSIRLTQLARSADIFVMVTWAATHAATDAIRAARPKHLPLLMPNGKGASSIIDAIEHWADAAHTQRKSRQNADGDSS